MATETGNTYISESMIDISEIPTGASSQKVPLGACNNDRQREMADKTGMTNSIETPMTIPGFDYELFEESVRK